MVARITDIVRAHADAVRQRWPLPRVCEKALWDIATCRTVVRGGHVEKCKACGHTHPFFNSCRNRHCPQCQGDKQKAWVDRRIERSVPVGHHQVVFTLPSELREAAYSHPDTMHRILFGAAAETLNQLGKTRLKAKIGFTGVLHTWARDLSYHPHVHCLVTGGGLREQDGEQPVWVDAQKFLFPVTVMRRLYRAKFFDRLDAAHREGLVRFDQDPILSGKRLASLKRKLRAKSWVVHIDAPEDRPVQQALRYLGRYVYRVAISDERLVSSSSGHVTFRTRDEGVCTLAPVEFVRRLLTHVLPRGFRKVRNYGLYAPVNRVRCERAQELVGYMPQPEQKQVEEAAVPSEESPSRRCLRCGGELEVIGVADWLSAMDDSTWNREYLSMLPWDDL